MTTHKPGRPSLQPATYHKTKGATKLSQRINSYTVHTSHATLYMGRAGVGGLWRTWVGVEGRGQGARDSGRHYLLDSCLANSVYLRNLECGDSSTGCAGGVAALLLLGGGFALLALALAFSGITPSFTKCILDR